MTTTRILPRLLAGSFAACLVSGALAPSAEATEGYFALGYSAAQRGQAGAGIAHAFDAMSATSNPANAASVGKEMSMGIEAFIPLRGYTGTGTFFVPSGKVESGHKVFPVPNFGYNMPLDNGNVLNFAAYGNGGMNTSYPTGLAGCGSVYCGGKAGVDLSQLFVSVTYAGKAGDLSWGISPTFAYQRFEARGLGAFGAISTDPANLTNRGHDGSTGFGLRAGLRYDLSDQFSVGITGQTKFNMSKFKKYAGLFANGGEFDIPAMVGVGMAFKPQPNLTLMLDYQKIFYSGIPAISNAGNSGPLGAPNGAGFGWDDVDVVKLGVEWQQSPEMIWRAGYAYASNPVGTEDVTLNIIAPGIVRHHFTVGGTRKFSDRDSLDFALVYVPTASISGPEVTPAGPTPGQVKLEMEQFSLSVGWTHKF